MARVSRKTTANVVSETPANPALDIGALVATEVAKHLAAAGNLPAVTRKNAKGGWVKLPAESKPTPAVTVIPPAENVPLRVVTGYRDKTTGQPVPFKGNSIKLVGLSHQPFGGVSLDLICEILDRETEIVKTIKNFRPASEEHKTIIKMFLNTLLGDE